MIFKSSSHQRKLIGYFRKLLCIDADTYYDMLLAYGVESSKQLSYSAAEELLQRLKKQAIAAGKFNPKPTYHDRYENLSGRQGMCTPKQLRYIDVLWKQVSRQSSDTEKEKALNAFIKRITGKERLNFLTQFDARKLIKAIVTMKNNEERRKNGTN